MLPCLGYHRTNKYPFYDEGVRFECSLESHWGVFFFSFFFSFMPTTSRMTSRFNFLFFFSQSWCDRKGEKS